MTLSSDGPSEMVGAMYAPDAAVNISTSGAGTFSVFGAVIAKSVRPDGEVFVHYDRRLRTSSPAGTPHDMTLFEWNR